MPAAANATAGSPPLGGFCRLWRVLRQLFHEVTGATFAVLALGWLNAAFRAWMRDAALWLVGIAVAVAFLFVFFAITSFHQARKL